MRQKRFFCHWICLKKLTFVTGADSVWLRSSLNNLGGWMMGKKVVLAAIFNGAFGLLLTILFANPFARAAADTQLVPQTARQALVEMLFSKTPGTFEKHLPQATRAALRKAHTDSGASMLDGFSLITSQLNARGGQMQTFEAGPTLVMIEDPQAHSKFEITVERDDLRGEEDEIELSFHGYKDGETQTAGTKFRFTLTMKQEAGTWRLNDVMVSVGVSLTDPAFLKAMSTSVRPTLSSTGTSMGNSQISTSGSSSMSSPAFGSSSFGSSSDGTMKAANETTAVNGVRLLNTAEVTYAAAYPGHGFTCSLSDLGGMGGGGGVNEHQAMLIDPRLAHGKKNGYVFTMSGCDGSPASKYFISAAPADSDSGTRAFCSDESGVIRFSEDGKTASCLTAGKPLQ
jgi:hypothetical protein